MCCHLQTFVEKHSLRCSEFLGDGHSKAHSQLKSERVYGDKEITKLECFGHSIGVPA